MGLAEEGNNNAATTTAVLQQQQLNENQQQRREGAAAKRKRRRDSSADYSSDHNISIPTLEADSHDVKKVRREHLLFFSVELQTWCDNNVRLSLCLEHIKPTVEVIYTV